MITQQKVYVRVLTIAFFTDKKPKPENVEIFTLKSTERRLKLAKITLAQLWEQGYLVRINNFSDKEKPPHCEKDIKSQVNY